MRGIALRLEAWLLAALERPVRALLWLIVHLLYRVRVVGQDHVPARGPALLVCNHVSWLDGLFVWLALRRRVRFLVWAPRRDVPGLRPLLALARAIVIERDANAEAVEKAHHEAAAALAAGEVVGLFAEGHLTHTGMLLPFQKGLEDILRRQPAPIIPTALDRLWGSIFSFQGLASAERGARSAEHRRGSGSSALRVPRSALWKVPHRLPYPVLVNFGAPLPADARTWRVRQAVQELLADCFELRREDQKPPHREFVRIACRHPARPCLIDPNPGGWRLNYGMTLTAAIALTRRLRRLLEPGDKAALLVPTSVGGALANIAVALLGRTAVNLNYTASQEAMRSALQQCHLRQVITARAFVEKIKPDLGPGVSFLYLEDLVKQVGRLERALTFLSVLFLPGVIMEYVILGLGRHSVDALATIIFSSGSTGDPKGVMLSHHNILSNVQSVCQAIDPLPPDRLLGVLPFFHSFGYMACLWLPLVIGASAVLYPDPRQAKEIGEFCHRFKCTLFISTPTFLRFFLRRSDPDDFRTLRLLITGAEKLPQALAREFARKFGVPPLEGYGTTELSPVVSFNVPDWDKGDFKQVGHKPGTIGQPVPGVAVKVVDVDTGAQLPPGAVGLLCVKGPNVMVGYLDRPEATAEAIRDGWYVTGDLARLDEDGFITITDRLSRFSKIAGEMVPHQRVEEEIHHLLGTSERVCVVTGLPDEKKGERLVVLYTDLHGHLPAAVAQQLAASGLPNLWLPDARSFYQVAELPILGSGKLDLQRVKRLAHEKSGR